VEDMNKNNDFPEIMEALIVESPGSVSLKKLKRPVPGEYEALVCMEMIAICNSTDLKIVNGKFPGINNYPTTLGHEGIGRVVFTGEKVRNFKIGDRVLNPMTLKTGVEGLSSSWGTMAQYSLVGDFAAMVEDGVNDEEHGFDLCFETQKIIPSEISNREAILLPTWREVFSSFSDFGITKGKSVLVFGGGPVGLSFVAIAKAYGLKNVCLSTRSDWKLKKADKLAADHIFKADDELIFNCKNYIDCGFDVIIDAVGEEEIINTALGLISFNGTIGVYGTISENNITLKNISSQYNWKLVMHQWPDYKKEAAAHEPLCEMIRNKQISSEEFITQEIGFKDLSKAFDLIEQNKALKIIINL